VNDALLVRHLERLGDLPCRRQRLVQGDWTALESLRQVLPWHQLHHEGTNPAALLETVDVRDVGVIQGGESLRLTREPRKSLRVARHLLRKNLEGDVAVQPGVAREVYLAHPTCADWGKDFVRPKMGSGSEAHD
jgi:hypothetical protein